MKRWMQVGLVILMGSVLLAGVGCQSCDPLDGTSRGRKATKEFFEAWNQGDWDAIVNRCDPELLKVTPAADVRERLRTSHGMLGNEVSTSEKRGESHVLGGQVVYWTDWDTKFERGSGIVNLQWKFDNGKTQLTGWHITPNAPQ